VTAPPDDEIVRSRRKAARPGGWDRAHAWLLVAIDVGAISVAVLVAISLGLVSVEQSFRAGDDIALDRVLTDLFVVLGWPGMLAASGAYERRSLGYGPEEYRVVVLAAGRLLSLLAIAVFLFDAPIHADFVLTVLGIGMLGSLIGRRIARKALHRRRADGHDTRRVLAVGSPASVASLVEALARIAYSGLRVVGAVVPEHSVVDGLLPADVPVLGHPAELLRAMADAEADAVAIADSSTLDGGAVRRLAWSLEGMNIDLLVVPTITDVAGPRVVVRSVGAVPLLYVEEPELTGPNRFAKAVFDRLAALFALLLTGPVLLGLALAIRATSAGPALFRQHRVGLDGQPFSIVKLRTMYIDADARKAELTEVVGAPMLFKMVDDPRVTPLGRFLRRWSIDELPQLWNVLRGDMSLVGPRPGLPDEVARYEEEVTRRLLVRPGITGLWQVSGRADLPWEESVRLDLFYVDNWSLALDVQILFRTVAAVVRGEGAY
jgi:exopolysaccharide biosynthesis polyprenyl glycosylphosphotransferase